jgi:hypothetical protein
MKFATTASMVCLSVAVSPHGPRRSAVVDSARRRVRRDTTGLHDDRSDTGVFILHSNPGSPAVLLVLVGAIVWLRRGQIVAQFTARPKAIGRGIRE